MSKLILLIILGLAVATLADDYRSFTDKEGRTIRAKIISVDTGKKVVTLERANKRKFTVDISIFSEADQDYIQSFYFEKEWFSSDSEVDFKYINMFIQHIEHSKRVIILGEINDTTNQLSDVRFTLETEDQKKALQLFMSKLDLREVDPTSNPAYHANQHGQIRYVDYSI